MTTTTPVRQGREAAPADVPAPARPGVRENPPVTADAVATLLARWRRDGITFAVVDERGRHRDELAAGRLDLTRSAAAEPMWMDAALHRAGYVVLDAGNVPRNRRPFVVGRALAAVQRLRARSGRPEWIVVEDAHDVLVQPGIPPQALRFDDGGYCLAFRDGHAVPAALRTGAHFDVRVSQPGLELALIPRAHL